MTDTDKLYFIDEHFKRWRRDLDKANELLSNPRYYLEGMLVLSCYLGAFATQRYPELSDRCAYVKVVLNYSWKRDFYEQIDLLFFYQWPESKLQDRRDYKALKQHPEIVAALEAVYGSQDDIIDNTRKDSYLSVSGMRNSLRPRSGPPSGRSMRRSEGDKPYKRYVSRSEFLGTTKAANIEGLDDNNLSEKLHLFSLARILYHQLRCNAVHNAEFPLINDVTDVDGNVRYEDNHVITGTILRATICGVWSTLWAECQKKTKWPHELERTDEPTAA